MFQFISLYHRLCHLLTDAPIFQALRHLQKSKKDHVKRGKLLTFFRYLQAPNFYACGEFFYLQKLVLKFNYNIADMRNLPMLLLTGPIKMPQKMKCLNNKMSLSRLSKIHNFLTRSWVYIKDLIQNLQKYFREKNLFTNQIYYISLKVITSKISRHKYFKSDEIFYYL